MTKDQEERLQRALELARLLLPANGSARVEELISILEKLLG